jgi:hypothetical protein
MGSRRGDIDRRPVVAFDRFLFPSSRFRDRLLAQVRRKERLRSAKKRRRLRLTAARF